MEILDQLIEIVTSNVCLESGRVENSAHGEIRITSETGSFNVEERSFVLKVGQ